MTETAVPAMPEFERQEQWQGSPFLLSDLPVAIGWQWLPAEQGGPSFVLARRTRMGTLRVTAQFPLSADGWAAAWHALAAASPESADRCLAALEERSDAQRARATRAAAPAPLDWREAARQMNVAQLGGERAIRLDGGLTLRAAGRAALPILFLAPLVAAFVQS